MRNVKETALLPIKSSNEVENRLIICSNLLSFIDYLLENRMSDAIMSLNYLLVNEISLQITEVSELAFKSNVSYKLIVIIMLYSLKLKRLKLF